MVRQSARSAQSRGVHIETEPPAPLPGSGKVSSAFMIDPEVHMLDMKCSFDICIFPSNHVMMCVASEHSNHTCFPHFFSGAGPAPGALAAGAGPLQAHPPSGG